MHKLISLVLPAFVLYVGAAPAQAQPSPSFSTDQLVTLWSNCPDQNAGVQPYVQVPSDGSVTGTFVVPAGLQFVVTDVEWLARDIGFDQSAAASTQFSIRLAPAGGNPLDFPIVYRSYGLYDADGFATGRDHFTGGIVVDSGFVFDSGNPAVDHVQAQFGTPPPDYCFINIRGYLADPKK